MIFVLSSLSFSMERTLDAFYWIIMLLLVVLAAFFFRCHFVRFASLWLCSVSILFIGAVVCVFALSCSLDLIIWDRSTILKSANGCSSALNIIYGWNVRATLIPLPYHRDNAVRMMVHTLNRSFQHESGNLKHSSTSRSSVYLPVPSLLHSLYFW